MSDKERGLYGKYIVQELDEVGELKAKQHEGRYFVLKVEKDPFAIPAMKAYARACADEYPQLAADINEWVAQALSIQTNARIEQFKQETAEAK